MNLNFKVLDVIFIAFCNKNDSIGNCKMTIELFLCIDVIENITYNMRDLNFSRRAVAGKT